MKIQQNTNILRPLCGAIALLATGSMLLSSCADDNFATGKAASDGRTVVGFTVSQAQYDAAGAAASRSVLNVPLTRAASSDGLAMQGLTPEDLAPRQLPVDGIHAADACIIETTVAGCDPVQGGVAVTRAGISPEPMPGSFGTIGFRGTQAGDIATPWFYNRETSAVGKLSQPIFWAYGQPYAVFYGIYPYASSDVSDLSPENELSPYIDFEAERDAQRQKDLMTACSGTVRYATQGIAPTPSPPYSSR